MSNKTKQLPFGFKLVLNQWIVSLFGHDPLNLKDGENTMRPIQPLSEALKEAQEGLSSDNLHHFYKVLVNNLQVSTKITQDDLLRYEDNIASHTLSINDKRERPIVWKYYQWLSLLFTEIYLERYFEDRDTLIDDLNSYVDDFNAYWANKNYETKISHYKLEDLNKLCFQNATGSGKTLLMHVNFLQFRHYVSKSKQKYDLTRSVLITPNEELSYQHHRTLKESGILSARLLTDSGELISSGKNGLLQIDYTEITKLGDKDGPNIIETRNLGDQNLLLVDEAHRGMRSKEERGWFKRRAYLSEKGFVFEYSATFKEAVTAANQQEIEDSYAKTILFDYSYRYFYEDGYGKDYRIFNLPRAMEEFAFPYMTACLLGFYQQLKLYEDYYVPYMPYNIEKPLWVFVGSSVTKATGKSYEKETASDVGKIISFVAKFVKNEAESSIATIEHILTSNAQETGLLDENDIDIFSGSFLYLQQLVKKEWTVNDLFHDLLDKIFHNRAGGVLAVARIKGNENEIMLQVGHANKPFGLINVGDANGLTDHFKKLNIDNVVVRESDFAVPFFSQISQSNSPINLLIGSKRFVEGWDCWRVSTLGLMRVGRNEGTQIIQLFGRGVRLKGYRWSLQRSVVATPTHQPERIQYVETLNVFGIEADFMERFRKFLEAEELPCNNQKQVFTVPLNVTYGFGQRLKVLCPRKKTASGSEYDFKRDGAVPTLGVVPDKICQNGIEIDWYPRIKSLSSSTGTRFGNREESCFNEIHLFFIDYEKLFFKLEKFKKERAWHNLNISKAKIKKLLENTSWYKIIAPARIMELSDLSNIALWQEMATELLLKYVERFYNYSKSAFIEPRLEFRVIKPGDERFPATNEYQLIVDAQEEVLINDIKRLICEVTAKKHGILSAGDLKGCIFNAHLYAPVLHTDTDSKIKIAPTTLNESEFQFIKDLRTYIVREESKMKSENTELFLLRNESRGRGIGFFEAGNFYPDFLLWLVKDGKQHLSFVEPHGLVHEHPESKKIEFHCEIKNIQKRLANENIVLNSFIVTPTNFSDLRWCKGKTPENLSDRHIFFMKEQADTYIASIIDRMVI